MLSTPIINPPQNAILGLHQIKERPVVDNGSLVARPIMYIVLNMITEPYLERKLYHS